MEEKNNKKITVFLVDDDDFLLEMYAMKFKNNGFDVEIAKNAEEALVKLEAGLKPDVILFDVVMPKIDGFDFIKKVKSANLAVGAKLVVLSNLGQKEDIEKGKALGVSDYVVKANHTPSEVMEKLKSIIKK